MASKVLLGSRKLREAKEKGARLPGPYSSEFAPVPEPTIRTGVTAMTSAVLDIPEKIEFSFRTIHFARKR